MTAHEGIDRRSRHRRCLRRVQSGHEGQYPGPHFGHGLIPAQVLFMEGRHCGIADFHAVDFLLLSGRGCRYRWLLLRRRLIFTNITTTAAATGICTRRRRRGGARYGRNRHRRRRSRCRCSRLHRGRRRSTGRCRRLCRWTGRNRGRRGGNCSRSSRRTCRRPRPRQTTPGLSEDDLVVVVVGGVHAAAGAPTWLRPSRRLVVSSSSSVRLAGRKNFTTTELGRPDTALFSPRSDHLRYSLLHLIIESIAQRRRTEYQVSIQVLLFSTP